MADLLLNIIGSDGASAAFRGVAISLEGMAKLAKDCTREFEQQARADRQLEAVMGPLTGAFKAQAAAMQEQLGVSDDMVEKMQTMLRRFGEAPDQIEGTVRALLDYSAATGVDAVQATSTLLSSVNSGKAAFKDLGLVYEQTGHKSADLVAVTQALAGKVGGSAKAEAGSLSGQTRIATEAINEFKESIGGLISEFVTKTGAVTTFTQAIRDLQVLLFGAQKDSLQGLQQNIDAAKEKLASMQAGWRDALTFVSAGAFEGYTKEEVDAQIKLIKSLEAEWQRADAARRQSILNGGGGLPGLSGPDELTNKGRKSAEKEAQENSLSAFQSYAEAKTQADFRFAEDQKRALEQLAKDRDEARAADITRDAQARADEDKRYEERREQLAKELQYRLDMDEKALKAAEKASKKLDDQLAAQNKRTRELMMEGATAIGLAFANALGDALSEALSGGEVDAIGVAADIGFAIAAIAASTIANIYAPGSGSLVGGLIGTAGSVVHGVRASAFKAEQAGRKRHEGGWIDGERFHDGGFIGLGSDERAIVAQDGEAILSRRHVANMGGRAGVERAARGGAAVVVNLSGIMDAGGVREFFEDRGGRGFYNAIRTGRGSLAQTGLGVL